MTLHINSQFDSGNIEVINHQSNPIELVIRPDHQSDFYQWFHFSVAGGKDKTKLKLSIINAAGAAFPAGWQHYQVVASYDRKIGLESPHIMKMAALNLTTHLTTTWFGIVTLPPIHGNGIRT